VPIIFKNILEETLRWEKLFVLENLEVIAEEKIVNLLYNWSNTCVL